MKRFFQIVSFILVISWTNSAFSNEFEKVLEFYGQGKYQATVDELEGMQKKVSSKKKGLIAYWMGMSYNRLQNFPMAIKSFEQAIRLKYDTIDLNYEFGQALFASERLRLAKIQFSESFKKGFKVGTCLYYMAYISKELGEADNTKTLYQTIKKLPPNEAKEVAQAAEFQLADIELEEAEKGAHALQMVEQKVIPIYESAFSLNPESALAPQIREKIDGLKKKYELFLFQLRNGRPTVLPRHFLRVAQEVGYDTNVVYAPTETTITKSEQNSAFSKTEAMGRYTHYYKNYFSVAPELRTNYSRYFNRVQNILKNDNLLIAPALRTSYEDSLWEKPASTLVDVEYNQVQRDVKGENHLEFASRSYALMVGERFKYFSGGDSTLRIKARKFMSYLESSNSDALSLIYEQILAIKTGTVLIYSSLDRTRVNTDSFDSNSFTLRGDWLMPSIKGINPSIGFATTVTDPINDRTNRGLEKLLNPGIRLNKRFGKNWGTNFRLEHFENISRDKKNFAYRKELFAFEVEYLF